MVPGDLAALMVQRNGVATHVARGTLPPMLRDPGPRGCGRCFALTTCSIAHQVIRAKHWWLHLPCRVCCIACVCKMAQPSTIKPETARSRLCGTT